jgi:hypothetical protein
MVKDNSMQTNPNIDPKILVEVWDWADTGHTDNQWLKKYYRKLRRRKLERELRRQAKDTTELNLEICEEFKYCEEDVWHK